MKEKRDVVGYLPDERPSFGKAILFALQQFLVMLPATVLAVIIMNGMGSFPSGIYSIPAAIIASGVATISFLLITKGKIPLYYGSSFSYIPAVGIVLANTTADNITTLGAILIASVISGLMSIGAGVLIKVFGKEKIDTILPGHITGMIAMIIGLSLAGNTMSGILVDSAGVDWWSVLISVITFLTIAILTVTLKKGFISQIPILLGLGVGVVFSYALWVPLGSAGGFANYFAEIGNAKSVPLLDVMPWHTIPAGFKDWNLLGVAIIAIFPIAFATIPESAAHVNQVDLYVNDLANQRPEKKDYGIRHMLDENLIGDGTADIVAVVLGGPAGTNYGENVSASAVTKNFSSYVFFLTGALAIIVGILLEVFQIGNISMLLTSPVIQGVSLYLFGAIAVQGIALMVDKKIDIFNPRVIAVMAFIGIVGLGIDAIKVNENFVLPGIGLAAFGGILLNMLLVFIEKQLRKLKPNNGQPVDNVEPKHDEK
ncbi:MAG: xanthine permease [Erysipelotrichia bacterium]|nr:xanthine permease [Erysipelotrichia bacterium]